MIFSIFSRGAAEDTATAERLAAFSSTESL